MHGPLEVNYSDYFFSLRQRTIIFYKKHTYRIFFILRSDNHWNLLMNFEVNNLVTLFNNSVVWF